MAQALREGGGGEGDEDREADARVCWIDLSTKLIPSDCLSTKTLSKERMLINKRLSIDSTCVSDIYIGVYRESVCVCVCVYVCVFFLLQDSLTRHHQCKNIHL